MIEKEKAEITETKEENLGQEKAIVKKKDNKLKTTSDRYIDQLTRESEKIMTSMGLDFKPEVKMALFNLGLSCERAIKEKKISWEQINIDGLASNLLHYAQLGLSPANNELYIYISTNKNGKYDLSFEESYFGKSKKVKKFSIDGLKEIIAFLVREGDIYEPKIDLVEGDLLTYNPEPFNDKPIRGAVCYLKFEDPNKNRITEMSLAELEKVKEASEKKIGKLSPAWRNWESEMQKKAVLKRAIKNVQIEVPAEYQAAYIATEEIDNSNYDMNFEERKTVVINKNDAIEAEFDEATVVIEETEEQTKSEEEINLNKTDDEVTNDSDYLEFE